MTTEEQLQKVINGTITDIQGKHDEPLCRVPNYANAQVKTWGSTLTASEDGWLRVRASGSNTSSDAKLAIDGNEFDIYGLNASITITVGSTSMFPIKSGQTYKATQGGGWNEISFIPSINSP